MWKSIFNKADKFWAKGAEAARSPDYSIRERSPNTKHDWFSVKFERAVNRIARDPNAFSISVRQCLEQFGDDLFRYVPIPKYDLNPDIRADSRWGSDRRFLDGKRWDSFKSPLEHFIQFRLARELVDGVCYRHTEAYRELKVGIAAGLPLEVNDIFLDSDEKVDRYCEYMRWLVDSVRENGLRSRREASHLFEQSFGEVRSAHREAREKEIHVAVDEQGEFLRLNSGRHRLAAAHALGLQEVPAKIHLVHVGWVMSLMRETETRPDIALRQGLSRFRSAVD